jgi:hypothetical protein
MKKTIGVLTLGPLIGAGFFIADAQTAARPPRNIFGAYGQSSRGRDSIRVGEKADGKISVAIRLYFANGHRCNLNGDGEWRGDHVALVAEGLTPARPCRLNVFFEKGRAVLKDEGLQCAPVYCGTRGEFDNVSLAKSNAGR